MLRATRDTKLLLRSLVPSTPFRYFATKRKWNKLYAPSIVEEKWQKEWYSANSSKAENDNKEKFYCLSMFPYPSGNLHMGHVRVYTISDTIARYKRMEGFDVLHPMGWDAFGLPAENAAIDRGLSPSKWTLDNIQHMKSQLLKLGTSFDWDKEVTTCDSEYYKWTQYIFLKMYEKGLAYQKEAVVNWDPIDQTVLANEQVDNMGKSWRSGAIVEKKNMKQWFFKITDYSDRLLNDIKELNGWPELVKSLQTNWIGKSSLPYFEFQIEGSKEKLRVATTRPDTIFGVTFIAIAPEHPQVLQLVSNDKREEATSFVNEIYKISYVDRSTIKSKKGVFLGIHVIHPLTNERIPVYTSNYVLPDYGTGIVMGVPAHDQRDYDFAKQYNLPIKNVIIDNSTKDKENEECISSKGVLINSNEYSGLKSEEASSKLIEFAKSKGFGGSENYFKLRDWLISRQRYWGAPIPLIHCKKCDVVPVPYEQLPVLLPNDIKLTGRGSPLSKHDSFVKTKCPKCGGDAHRETDTMDTFVDSSWYFLRYPDATNKNAIFDSKKTNNWLPVHVYIGGVEHAILHLLYSRFLTKALNDQGFISISEPFKNLITQGMVHGKTFKVPDTGKFVREEEVLNSDTDKPIEKSSGKQLVVSWEKMSKSKYNGVDPVPVIDEYGADTVRLFILFKAPPENVLEWDIKAIQGIYRWLSRLWSLVGKNLEGLSEREEGFAISEEEEKSIMFATHMAIKNVTNYLDIENHTFNVAIAELMKLSNSLSDVSDTAKKSLAFHKCLRCLCILLSPMAPHIASEMWSGLTPYSSHLSGDWFGDANVNSVLSQSWPKFNPQFIQVSNKIISVMIQGKTKGTIEVPVEVDSSEIEKIAKEQFSKFLKDRTISKIISPPNKNVINFVLEK